VEHVVRVFLLEDRQQRGEVAHVLLEQVEDRRDPAFTKPDSWPYTLGYQLFGSSVGGVLEKRDTGLTPQLPTEQERRVGAQRNLHSRDRLGRVPVRGELLRPDLEVKLHAGARGLGRDRVAVGVQALDAVDVNEHIFAAG